MMPQQQPMMGQQQPAMGQQQQHMVGQQQQQQQKPFMLQDVLWVHEAQHRSACAASLALCQRWGEAWSEGTCAAL